MTRKETNLSNKYHVKTQKFTQRQTCYQRDYRKYSLLKDYNTIKEHGLSFILIQNRVCQKAAKTIYEHTTTVANGAREKRFPSLSFMSASILCLLTKQRTKTAMPTTASIANCNNRRRQKRNE